MAHNLEIIDGAASFVSANNQTAWHNLGVILPDELLTAVQCINHARMGYTVDKKPAVMLDGFKDVTLLDGSVMQVPVTHPIADTFATYRTDNNHTFGTVGKKYTIVQNSDAFAFFDAIVGEGAAIYETAGVLGKGERIFLTARLNDFCRIEGTNDITQMYIVLTMSHDGSGSIKAMITPIRVVCQNTLNAAIKDSVNTVNIRHTSSAVARLEQAHKVLGISNKYMTEFSDIMNAMAKVSVKDTYVDDLINKLFPTSKDEVSTRAQNIRTDVLTAYHSGIGQNGIVGTAYGVYNGVTNYLNHVKTYGNPDKDADRSNTIKFESVMEGQACKIQQACFDNLYSLIAAN